MLRGIWERVAGERVPHLVTVLGPAGIGKTRLTQEFERVVEELGGRSVHGRSLPYRESSAYFGFAMQVKQLCGIFDSDPPEVALGKLGEHVAELPSGADASEVTRHLAILLGLDSEGRVDDREELFFSVRCFIESVARDRPTLLVFEDIHWSDRSLLDLIELLAARLRDLPIMLLSLARPELLDSRTAWGGGLPAYTALPLPALSTEDSQKLAGLRLQGLEQRGRRAARRDRRGQPALHRAARGDDGRIVEHRRLAADDGARNRGRAARRAACRRALVAARRGGRRQDLLARRARADRR